MHISIPDVSLLYTCMHHEMSSVHYSVNAYVKDQLTYRHMYMYVMGPELNLNVAYYVCYILYKCYICCYTVSMLVLSMCSK